MQVLTSVSLITGCCHLQPGLVPCPCEARELTPEPVRLPPRERVVQADEVAFRVRDTVRARVRISGYGLGSRARLRRRVRGTDLLHAY